MSVEHVKFTLEWDQLDLASVVTSPEALDLDRWLTTYVRVIQEPSLPEGFTLPLYQSTFLRLRLEAVDSLGRRLHRRP